jgi:transcriptional regulator with PAS, ATPase and Fis domain
MRLQASTDVRLTRLEATTDVLLQCLTSLVFGPDARATPTGLPGALGETDLMLATQEARLIATALRRTNGNQRRAAALLGISRRVLSYKLHEAEPRLALVTRSEVA